LTHSLVEELEAVSLFEVALSEGFESVDAAAVSVDEPELLLVVLEEALPESSDAELGLEEA